MHWRYALLTTAFGVVCLARISSADAPAAKPLAPVPSPAERSKVEKTIHALFKDEFSRQDAASRKALAAKLLTQGSQGDSLATQYVLLQDSTDLAAGAGDVAGAFRAVDAMALVFNVDTIDLKSTVLTTASRAAGKPADAAALADASSSLADDAVAAGRYEVAVKLSAQAENDAKAAKDVGLYNSAHAKAEEIQAASRLAQKFKAADERLKQHPDDPSANLAVGKFLCLVKGDWEGAMPYLSRGSDNALAVVAKQDLANPADPKVQLSLADAWWDLSQDPKAGFKGAARRAAIWYRKAMPSLTGLQKTAAQKRLLASGRSSGGAHLTICKFVVTDNTQLFLPTSDPSPDVLTVAQQPMQIRVSGVKTFDAVPVAGITGCHFGKALFFNGTEASGSMHVDVSAANDKTLYYLLMTNKQDVTHTVSISPQENAIYTWTVSEKDGVIRLEMTQEEKKIGAISLPAEEFKSYGFGVTVRHPGNKADVTVSFD